MAEFEKRRIDLEAKIHTQIYGLTGDDHRRMGAISTLQGELQKLSNDDWLQLRPDAVVPRWDGELSPGVNNNILTIQEAHWAQLNPLISMSDICRKRLEFKVNQGHIEIPARPTSTTLNEETSSYLSALATQPYRNDAIVLVGSNRLPSPAAHEPRKESWPFQEEPSSTQVWGTDFRYPK
jgi:hypothetical protein